MGSITLDFAAVPLVATGSSALGLASNFTNFPLVATLSGEATIPNEGYADLTLPAMTIEADSEILPYASAVLTVPVPVIAAHGITGRVGNAALRFPALKITAEGYYLYGDVALLIPAPHIAADGITGLVGDAALSFPFIIIAADGWTMVEGGAILYFPVMRIAANGISYPDVLIRKGLVMNMSHFGVAEYFDFPFNSFAYLNGVLLAAGNDGIFAIQGNKDDGKLIQSTVRYPTVDAFGPIKRKLYDCYVTFRSDGQLEIKVKVDENPIYDVETIEGNRKILERKAKMPRGIKGRYYTFEVKNVEGSDFDLQSFRMMGEDLPKVR